MKRLIFIFLLTALALTSSAGLSALDQNRPVINDSNRFELKIYPNPAETGRITLELATGEIAEIKLVNIAGKEIISLKLELGFSKYLLPLEGVPNGIYFVRVISTEEKVFVKKLVVSGR
jgi:hypothetical protein